MQLRRGTTRSFRRTIPLFVAAVLMLGTVGQAVAQSTPAGEVTIAWHVTIAPTWLSMEQMLRTLRILTHEVVPALR